MLICRIFWRLAFVWGLRRSVRFEKHSADSQKFGLLKNLAQKQREMSEGRNSDGARGQSTLLEKWCARAGTLGGARQSRASTLLRRAPLPSVRDNCNTLPYISGIIYFSKHPHFGSSGQWSSSNGCVAVSGQLADPLKPSNSH